MRRINGSEPVAIWGSIGLLVGLLAQRWIPDLQAETPQLIADVVAQGLPVLIGLWYARRQVTPVSKIEQ